MILKTIEMALEIKPAGEGSDISPEEKRLLRFNNTKPMKIPKYVKEYFNNRKKYQQPRKANKSVGDST